MKSKKGIQLTINMIVVLLMSITILILALVLAGKIFSGVDDIEATLTDQTVKELNRLLDNNARVQLLHSAKTIERGDFDNFALGIKNIDNTFGPYFRVEVRYDKGVAEDGSDIQLDINDQETINQAWWDSYMLIQNPTPNIPVNKRDHSAIAIGVRDTARSGTYIFNVLVCEGASQPASCNPNDLYGDRVKQIWVTVP